MFRYWIGIVHGSRIYGRIGRRWLVSMLWMFPLVLLEWRKIVGLLPLMLELLSVAEQEVLACPGRQACNHVVVVGKIELDGRRITI